MIVSIKRRIVRRGVLSQGRLPGAMTSGVLGGLDCSDRHDEVGCKEIPLKRSQMAEAGKFRTRLALGYQVSFKILGLRLVSV